MCNCTKKRDGLIVPGTQFEYLGTQPFSVRGNVTQDIYRFQPGEIKTIDKRDVPGMENISSLKKNPAS